MNSKPPEELVFFLDRNLGRKHVAEALRSEGARVEPHDDHFAPHTPDHDWLREVGKRGWVVLSKDTRIRYRPNELAALREAGVVAVFLTAGNLAGLDMAELFRKNLRHISKAVANADRPTIFTFGRDGRLKRI